MKHFYGQFFTLRTIGVIFLTVFGTGRALAQCDCDHTVGPEVRHFYGDEEGVLPGDVICVEAGNRGQLRFHNITGTEANPVVIKNCGGQVVITATGGGQANVPLSLNGNKHFHLTGTGDPAFEYGFKIGGEAHASVDAQGRATNFEMDHIEVFASGFAGFMLKTDPDSGERNVRPEDPDAVDGGFTMYDISVHDCYIHDMLPDGEGIYMGHSFWSSGKKRKDNPEDRQYPHSIYGAKIFNNLIERTGREAIQAGAVVEGLEIYNNEIYDYGYQNDSGSQNNGIQIGEGSSGKIYNNFIKNGPDGGSRAIYLLGLGDNYVYNNVVIGADNVALNANLRPSTFPDDPGNQGMLGGAYFINNTIVDTKGAATFSTYLNTAPDNVLYNNLVITANDNWDAIIDGDWTKSNNLRYETLQEAGVTELYEDYRLESSSGAKDAGMDVSAYGVDVDYLNTTRPQNGIYDVGAFELAAIGNAAPVLSLIGDLFLDEEETLQVNISATDAEQDNIVLTASNLPSFATFQEDAADGILTLAPQQGDAGVYAGVMITADDGNGGVDLELFTITVTADDAGSGTGISGTVLYRINSGGNPETDPELDWTGDKQTSPSVYFDNEHCVNYTTGSNTWSGINETHAPDNLFGPYRYDNGASFGERQHWDFPVINGTYEVRLYFRAIGSASGSNVFDVSIEDVVELNDYDVYAATGGSGIAIEESFFVNVSDGNLDIDLPEITAGKSFVHGIEILSSANNPPLLDAIGNQSVDEDAVINLTISATDPDGDDISLTAANLPAFASFTDHGNNTGTLFVSPQLGDAGVYTGVLITSADGNGGEDTETISITVNDSYPGGAVLYRINAGGLLESDAAMDWKGDKQTEPSTYFDQSNCVNYTTGPNTWSGTNTTNAPDNIFGNYRYDNGASWGERQHWDFPVSNGSYEVRLYFRAIGSSSGSNVFDVAIEGVVKLDEYDIYATAGGSNIPVEESFIVSVSDGNLDIDFPDITAGRSMICGIEILTDGATQRITPEMKKVKTSISVFPNPMDDQIHIMIPDVDVDESVAVYLMDTSGRILIGGTEQGVSGEIQLDISALSLPSGIYYLRVQTENFHEVKKMIRK